MLKIAIIDDEPKAVSNLSHLLDSIFMKYDYDANVIFETTTVDSLLNYLNENTIDVLFLDIELKSYMSGLDIAERVRKTNKNCYFIFITAFSEYGLDAYKYKTFDYITKPFDSKRVEDCINRLFEDINGLPRKFIKIDNKNTIIEESEIKYIHRDGMKIVFHTASRDYKIYSSFNKLKNKLPPNFVRCHKSFIANINNITKVEPLKNIVYFDSSFCDIGHKYKNNFMEVINHSRDIK